MTSHIRLKSTFLGSSAAQQQVGERRQVVEVGVRVGLARVLVVFLHRCSSGGGGWSPRSGGGGGCGSSVTTRDVG